MKRDVVNDDRFEDLLWNVRLRIPQQQPFPLTGPLAGRGEHPSVARERHVSNGVRLAAQQARQLAALKIPQPDPGVGAAGGE